MQQGIPGLKCVTNLKLTYSVCVETKSCSTHGRSCALFTGRTELTLQTVLPLEMGHHKFSSALVHTVIVVTTVVACPLI